MLQTMCSLEQSKKSEKEEKLILCDFKNFVIVYVNLELELTIVSIFYNHVNSILRKK